MTKIQTYLCILITTISLNCIASNSNLPNSSNHHLYRNQYFGFSIQLPNSWHIQSQTQMDTLSKLGGQIADINNSNTKTRMESHKIKKIQLLSATQKPLGTAKNSALNIVGTKLQRSQPALSTTKQLAAIAYTLNQVRLFKPSHITTPSTTTLNSTAYATMTVTIPLNKSHVVQQWYCRKEKGFFLCFILSRGETQSRGDIKTILSSLRFNHSKK